MTSIMELQDKLLDEDYVRAGDIIQRVMDTTQQYIDTSFVMNRIWVLASDGVLMFKGLPNYLHQISIRYVKM